MERLKRYFIGPVFPNNPEKTLKARQFNIINLCGIVSMLVFAVLEVFTRPASLALNEGILLVVVLFMAGLGQLNRSGRVTLACWLLLLFASAALNVSVIGTGAIRATGFAANMIIILLTGMLIDLRAALGYAIVISLVGLGLVAAESRGLLTSQINNSPAMVLAFLTICFLYTVGILQVMTSGLRSALTDTRRELDERLKAEEALQHANEELIETYDSTIEGLVRALHFRDNETEEHTQRVTSLTEKLARTLGLAEEEILQMRRGALLHDIGKIGIPDQVLLKAGPLTEEERRIIEKHTQYAYEILYSIPRLRSAIDIPYRHHERWDGNGYPGKLQGEQIPLAARLFAVVDVWDAVRNPRIFRKTVLSDEEAVAYLQSEAGKRFDPQIVASFLSMDLSQEE